VVVRPEELKRLRKANSPDMQILRSVKMQEIDPVFLETSYEVIPGLGGEKSYALLYLALAETKLAALAQVAIHGREHVIVLRAGAKGLIAPPCSTSMRCAASTNTPRKRPRSSVKSSILRRSISKRSWSHSSPEEFTDGYREQLQALIASKEAPRPVAETGKPEKATGNVVDTMDALRKSLEAAKAASSQRRPAASEVATDRKPRKRKA